MAERQDPGIWAVTTARFHQSDGELLESGLMADTEVKCGKRTWKAHKIILCTRSDWFKKALMGPFEEGQTGKVTITDFKPADIDFLLNFIYTGVINLRKSYPGETTWSALIEIWKMADFFCLDTLRDLVIAAAKDRSLEIARVFCAFDPPDGYDQERTGLFGNEFGPAVKAIYEDEMESIKHHFGPIILGLAVASVHRFSEMEAFEKLLRDVPLFAADWAAALMKGLPKPFWGTNGWGFNDKCADCNRLLQGSGVVDTFSFMRQCPRTLCRECYKGPDLELWKDPSVSGWN